MKGSHEVSQAGVRKALRPWSLTTLPFALALDTPHTKLGCLTLGLWAARR